MAKNKIGYFPHDVNARNDTKILALRAKHGAAGYGVYFMILERLRDSSDYMSVKAYNEVAFDLHVSAGLIKSVVEDFGLFTFTDDGERFYSESLNRRMKVIDEISRSRSEAGRRAINARWSKRDAGTIADEYDGDTTTLRDVAGNDTPRINKNTSRIKNDTSATPEGYETDTNKIKVNKKKKESKEKKSRPATFCPPLFSEVEDFVKQSGLDISATRFYEYYTANGWKAGRSQIVDWQAAARAWQAKEPRRQKPAPFVIDTGTDTDDQRRARAEQDRKDTIEMYNRAVANPGSRYETIVRGWQDKGLLERYGLKPLPAKT